MNNKPNMYKDNIKLNKSIEKNNKTNDKINKINNSNNNSNNNNNINKENKKYDDENEEEEIMNFSYARPFEGRDIPKNSEKNISNEKE